jgi:hypothetical protein
MNRVALSGRRRRGIYAVGAGLWGSGALWLVAHYFWLRQGEYGPEVSPAEPVALAAHGAFAMVSLWFAGLLWGVHVLAGWRSGRGRWSGGLTLAGLLVLAVTGYLLYYVGDDGRRAAASLVHWVLGLALLPLFLWHRLGPKPAKTVPGSPRGSTDP